jgi:hypothetical protein
MPENTHTTKAERTAEEESPHHPRWLNIFTLFSWWKTSDGRVLVIRQRWRNATCDHLEYLELLEMNKELVKTVPYEVFFREYTAGKLTKTSVENDEDETKPYTANLWPDRVN